MKKMKKTLSILLSVILVFSSFAAFGLCASAADDTLYLGTGEQYQSLVVPQNTSFIVGTDVYPIGDANGQVYKHIVVKAGGKIEVRAGATLQIGQEQDLVDAYVKGTQGFQNEYATVEVQIGENAGDFFVSKNARIDNYGKISGVDTRNIGTDEFYNYVYLPENITMHYNRTNGINFATLLSVDADGNKDFGVPTCGVVGCDKIGTVGHHIEFEWRAITGDESVSDTDYTSWANYKTSHDGPQTDKARTIPVRLGDTIYIACNVTDHDEKCTFPYVTDDKEGTPNYRKCRFIDTNKMQISENGIFVSPTEKMDATRGLFAVKPQSAICVNVPNESYRYDNIARTFEITLPRNNGYYVVSDKGEEDKAIVKFGETLSFKVVLNPDYDKSKNNVVVHWGTLALEPDDYGFYDVTGPIKKKTDKGDQAATDKELTSGYYSTEFYYMEEQGGIQQSADISVMGVISNEKSNSLNNAFSTIRQVFQIIKEIFQEIFGMFKNLFS